jgi:hypothetical protein
MERGAAFPPPNVCPLHVVGLHAKLDAAITALSSCTVKLRDGANPATRVQQRDREQSAIQKTQP